MAQPPDDEYVTRADLRAELARFERRVLRTLRRFATKEDLKRFATKEDLERFATKDDLERFATKDDLERYATKDDLERGLARCATKEDLERGLARCATKEDVERMGRVLAWGLIGGMGVMLAATLAGMWGVVHTLVSTAG